MKYTASQLVNRALHLADIANTDFLIHEELTQYINDAWQSVYQWMINHGDTAFVKEMRMTVTAGGLYFAEYNLPSDFYQMKSITDTLGHPLNRRVNGINGYEIYNDKLRLYGATGELIVQYYAIPTFITFPERTLQPDTIPNEVLDTAINSVLDANGNVINIVTGSTVAQVEEAETLGNGYIIKDQIVYDYDGNEINELPENASIHKDRSGALFYQILEDGKYGIPKSAIDNAELTELDTGLEYITSNAGEYIAYDQAEQVLKVYSEERSKPLEIPVANNPRSFTWMEDIDNNPAFYVITADHKVYVYDYDEEGFEYDILKYRTVNPVATLRYGILEKSGELVSVIPDTDMNFPSEMYFSLIACDLALRFAMKMNANTDGLNNLYTNMQYTFMNTLGQDADYPRIKNAY